MNQYRYPLPWLIPVTGKEWLNGKSRCHGYGRPMWKWTHRKIIWSPCRSRWRGSQTLWPWVLCPADRKKSTKMTGNLGHWKQWKIQNWYKSTQIMITGTTVELIQISKLILCYKGIVDLLPQAGMCAREHSWQSTSRRCVDAGFSPFCFPFDIEILIWRPPMLYSCNIHIGCGTRKQSGL